MVKNVSNMSNSNAWSSNLATVADNLTKVADDHLYNLLRTFVQFRYNMVGLGNLSALHNIELSVIQGVVYIGKLLGPYMYVCRNLQFRESGIGGFTVASLMLHAC